MIYYSEQYDQLGILSDDGRMLRIQDGNIFLAYLADRWTYVGNV